MLAAKYFFKLKMFCLKGISKNKGFKIKRLKSGKKNVYVCVCIAFSRRRKIA